MRLLIIKNGNCETDITVLIKEIDKDIETDLFCSRSIDYNTINIFKYDGVIIMGGPQRLSDPQTLYDHPYLTKLILYLKFWIEKDIKILGICLGAQLIALATGHLVVECEKLVMGYNQNILTTDNGIDDEVFGRDFDLFKYYYLTLHYDRVFIMSSGKPLQILAKLNDMVYGFRINRTYGVQFHPDVTLRILNLFCSEFNFSRELVDEGTCIATNARTANIAFLNHWIQS